MKKTLTLALSFMLVLSLAACGGVNKNAVAEAFNKVSNQFDEVANLMNENVAKMDASTIEAATAFANLLNDYKTEIESDELTQERADEIEKLLADAPRQIADMKAAVDAMLSAPEFEPMSDEQAALATEIADELVLIYDNFMLYQDNLDEATLNFVNEIGLTVGDITTLLTTENVSCNEAATVLDGCQQMLEAARSGWAELEAQF